MDTEIWRDLLGLESVDLVTRWHKKLFDRSLSSTRAHEITASAKQAREYFRNALASGDVVRPLLTFYGVASLARATVLLLRPGTGEASLVRGHGLETVDWPSTLSGDLSKALGALGSLTAWTTFCQESRQAIKRATNVCRSGCWFCVSSRIQSGGSR